MSGAADLWRPLRAPIFRQLLVADVVSDVGTFMQGVGAAWLMVSLGAGPLYVALTQTASTLPFFLLALTVALSAGDAFETPTWRAVLPELVRKDDLPAAAALNGIEFNIARAVGPALAGVLIAVAGVGAAFLVNVASFRGVLLLVARWRR